MHEKFILVILFFTFFYYYLFWTKGLGRNMLNFYLFLFFSLFHERTKKKNLKLVKIAFGIQNQWIFLTFKQPSFILFLVEGFIIIKKKKNQHKRVTECSKQPPWTHLIRLNLRERVMGMQLRSTEKLETRLWGHGDSNPFYIDINSLDPLCDNQPLTFM